MEREREMDSEGEKRWERNGEKEGDGERIRETVEKSERWEGREIVREIELL